MSNLIIEKLLAKSQRTDIPPFRPGDTVRVHVKIKEGDKERVQAFEGVVIKRDNGPQASFTVRKISFGQGVERIFPVHSKVIDKVELLRSSKVRRARLFYLRGLRGKAARLRDVEKAETADRTVRLERKNDGDYAEERPEFWPFTRLVDGERGGSLLRSAVTRRMRSTQPELKVLRSGSSCPFPPRTLFWFRRKIRLCRPSEFRLP